MLSIISTIWPHLLRRCCWRCRRAWRGSWRRCWRPHPTAASPSRSQSTWSLAAGPAHPPPTTKAWETFSEMFLACCFPLCWQNGTKMSLKAEGQSCPHAQQTHENVPMQEKGFAILPITLYASFFLLLCKNLRLLHWQSISINSDQSNPNLDKILKILLVFPHLCRSLKEASLTDWACFLALKWMMYSADRSLQSCNPLAIPELAKSEAY